VLRMALPGARARANGVSPHFQADGWIGCSAADSIDGASVRSSATAVIDGSAVRISRAQRDLFASPVSTFPDHALGCAGENDALGHEGNKRMLRTVYLLCWLALPVASLIFGPSGAAAQGTPEARQACAPDAMRLCSDFIPDVPKITRCMKAKYAQLSQECRLAMRPHRNAYRHHRKSQEMCWGMPCNN
jgi:hypothetical protein